MTPALARFVRESKNIDAIRTALDPWLDRVVAYRHDERLDGARGWVALDWILREHLPAWLRFAGAGREAESMEALKPLDSYESGEDGRAVFDAIPVAALGAYETKMQLRGPIGHELLRAELRTGTSAMRATVETAFAAESLERPLVLDLCKRGWQIPTVTAITGRVTSEGPRSLAPVIEELQARAVLAFGRMATRELQLSDDEARAFEKAWPDCGLLKLVGADSEMIRAELARARSAGE